MKYLIYLSTAVDLLDDKEIHALLDKSRARNTSNNITGILLYHEGSFIQLLEGEKDAVDATFTRISKDPSHKNIIVIDEGELDKRIFGKWSMGFEKATAQQVADIEAYTDPRKLKQSSSDADHPALSMLKTFVSTNLG